MGRRQEQRVAQRLMVWVAGRDTRGHQFRQTAKIIDISQLGARLGEIRCLRGPGEQLELRSRGRKARFQVVWIDAMSGEAGIRCMEPTKNLWRVEFPPASPDKREPAKAAAAGSLALGVQAVGGWITGTPAKASPPVTTGYAQSTREPSRDVIARPGPQSQMAERRERQHPRHRCSGGAEIRKESLSSQSERIWGRLTQISLGGCFVAAMHPFAPQTKVTLFLGIQDVQLRTKGIVCRSIPGVGMGVRFTEVDERNQQGLEELTSNLEKGGRFSQFA